MRVRRARRVPVRRATWCCWTSGCPIPTASRCCESGRAGRAGVPGGDDVRSRHRRDRRRGDAAGRARLHRKAAVASQAAAGRGAGARPAGARRGRSRALRPAAVGPGRQSRVMQQLRDQLAPVANRRAAAAAGRDRHGPRRSRAACISGAACRQGVRRRARERAWTRRPRPSGCAAPRGDARLYGRAEGGTLFLGGLEDWPGSCSASARRICRPRATRGSAA